MKKKDLILYGSIFLLSFISSSVFFYFYLKSIIPEPEIEVEEVVEKIPIPEEFIDFEHDALPDPAVEYKNLMLLKQKLFDIFAEDEYLDYSRAEVDSMLFDFASSIDSVSVKIVRYIDEIRRLQNEKYDLRHRIDQLNRDRANYQEKISDLQKQHQAEMTAAKTERYSDSIKTLAETYSTMNANRVAQLLQPLDNQVIIDILKNMDQRRAGKVLESLPPARASAISQDMLE